MTGIGYRNYLRPEVVSRLSRLDIVARLVVEGFITGLHKSPYHGFSVEFTEHRQYMPGDPIRDIDWKAYGKSDRLFVKQYEEETNLRAHILLDASGSMGFRAEGRGSSSDGVSKFQYGRYLAAALSFLMLRQRDAVGLVVFDERIRRFIPPRSVGSHLHVLLRELDAAEPSEETDVSSVLHELAERIARRGLIVLISDLFVSDPAQMLSGLRHLRHRKHEVIVFHVLDSLERDLAFREDAKFVDLETGEEIVVQPWHVRRAYRERMEEMERRYLRACRESAIDYALMDTSTPFDKALLEYLAKRKKLG